MRTDLTGQVALLNGAETEVGAQVARRLADAGAQIAAGLAYDARQEFGRLDMAVNCVPLADRSAGPVADMAGNSPALRLAARFLREAATAMRGQGSGRIVTAAGIGAIVVRRDEGARSAAMAGIASLTRTAALEFASDNVLVNAVAAGPGEDAVAHIPIGRPVSPASVANAIMFLLAPAASYVTGHLLVVDGGFSAGYVRNF
ncbi:MAG: SDR family oxidoreductase [Acetobacteraceae bacterium]|nr:SDR family oxidoreductase [Acetobacteraceae bacterium]